MTRLSHKSVKVMQCVILDNGCKTTTKANMWEASICLSVRGKKPMYHCIRNNLSHKRD